MPDLMFVAYQFNERSPHSKVVSSGLRVRESTVSRINYKTIFKEKILN